MRFEITLCVTTPDGELQEHEAIVLDKGHDQHEDTGLSIEEGKALLKSLQLKIVEAQAEAFCASKSVCQGCRRRLRKNGTHAIRYRTAFGDIPITSPRYYRCPCDGQHPETFSPLTELLPDHTVSELLWLETRWPPWSRSGPRSTSSRMSCLSTKACAPRPCATISTRPPGAWKANWQMSRSSSSR